MMFSDDVVEIPQLEAHNRLLAAVQIPPRISPLASEQDALCLIGRAVIQ